MQSILERAIDRAVLVYGTSKRILCMRIEAPAAPAERLLRLPGYENKILWSPSTDEENSGVGAASVLIAAGGSRFVHIKEAAARVFQEIIAVRLADDAAALEAEDACPVDAALDGDAAPAPRFFGGFRFQPARCDSPLWRGFGDAHFILPRISYTRRARSAWLTLAASGRELSSAEGRSRLAGEADQALEALRRDSGGAACAHNEVRATEGAADIWSVLVTGILGEIAAGRLEKAVAARHVVLRGACLPSAARVLERLQRADRDCARFALSVGDRTFLGASPERMVKCFGKRVWTEALAGTVPSDDPSLGQSLFLSPKNRLEHAIVAREIRASLAPLYESLAADGPHLHRLHHVSHLRTRFDGILKQPVHVLDLVARLHPTPAVGGTPRSAALAWLAQHEHADRGLYAGPFGAFDRDGNGEFLVAIRSALLGANEAHLFAGAGIVQGSEVESELCETRWKLQGLMTAIGSRPPDP